MKPRSVALVLVGGLCAGGLLLRMATGRWDRARLPPLAMAENRDLLSMAGPFALRSGLAYVDQRGVYIFHAHAGKVEAVRFEGDLDDLGDLVRVVETSTGPLVVSGWLSKDSPVRVWTKERGTRTLSLSGRRLIDVTPSPRGDRALLALASSPGMDADRLALLDAAAATIVAEAGCPGVRALGWTGSKPIVWNFGGEISEVELAGHTITKRLLLRSGAELPRVAGSGSTVCAASDGGVVRCRSAAGSWETFANAPLTWCLGVSQTGFAAYFATNAPLGLRPGELVVCEPGQEAARWRPPADLESVAVSATGDSVAAVDGEGVGYLLARRGKRLDLRRSFRLPGVRGEVVSVGEGFLFGSKLGVGFVRGDSAP